MQVRLRILDGPQAGAACDLGPGQRVVLGRGEETDLCVLDGWVSREHCAVTAAPSGPLLEDLESKNGTYVAGQRVTRCKLADGMLIHLGATTVEVLAQPTAEQVAAAAGAGQGLGLRQAAALLILALLLGGLAWGGYRLFGRRSEGTAPAPSTPSARPRTSARAARAAGGTPVTFTSEPAGAMVFVDDEYCDVTPLNDCPVPPGEHALRVQKAGYAVHRGTFTVGSRPGEPVHVVLKLAERGTLDIRSTPEGADVYLDNELRGKTPLRLEYLEPRAYTVRLLKQNFIDWQQTVAVRANETTTVQAPLGHREIGYYLAKLKEDPNNVSYYGDVAHLYLLEKNIPGCVENLAKAVEITYFGQDSTKPAPYRERLHELLGRVYTQDHFSYGDAAFMERVRDALDGMLAQLAVQHADSPVVLHLARGLYKRAGTPDRLVNLYLKLAEAQPANSELFAEVLAHLQRAGEARRVEELLQKAIAATPKDYRLHLLLGRIHLAAHRQGVAGAREKAIQALNAALESCTDEETKQAIRRLLGRATR
jgi:tetratricopeptide (TPR) repeat protein